ncbi:MAG: PEP-CTERM sorting domain-containing protein [Pseudomonadota bacterium]
MCKRALVAATLLLVGNESNAVPISLPYTADFEATGGARWQSIAGNEGSAGDIDLDGPTGNAWRDAEFGNNSDPYDDFGIFALDGRLINNPDDTVELTAFSGVGELLQFDTLTQSGLSVSMDYFFSENDPFARFGLFIENDTDSSITTTLRGGGDLGSDSFTDLHLTSSGDATATTADTWSLTTDNGGASANEIVSFAWGLGATDLGIASGADDIWAEFTVDIGANESLYYAFFTGLEDNRARGVTQAQNTFASITAIQNAGLLTGLSNEQLSNLRNWERVSVPAPATLALFGVGLAGVGRIRKTGVLPAVNRGASEDAGN